MLFFLGRVLHRQQPTGAKASFSLEGLPFQEQALFATIFHAG